MSATGGRWRSICALLCRLRAAFAAQLPLGLTAGVTGAVDAGAERQSPSTAANIPRGGAARYSAAGGSLRVRPYVRYRCQSALRRDPGSASKISSSLFGRLRSSAFRQTTPFCSLAGEAAGSAARQSGAGRLARGSKTILAPMRSSHSRFAPRAISVAAGR
ncbi:MAG: hypothetical protein FD139_3738 [Methylocystaceae bacterium]|nr:MAG: hypothetical protein FD148_2777 [Methylocystaceae bacterium]KAF0205937.1 MAG: hypothetical protein FD172_4010 [Methylocystaceae bacterium]TXT42296.1 MAG: hypothetical protein FD139_3738 [Methylocystaceae bacterium]